MSCNFVLIYLLRKTSNVKLERNLKIDSPTASKTKYGLMNNCDTAACSSSNDIFSTTTVTPVNQWSVLPLLVIGYTLR